MTKINKRTTSIQNTLRYSEFPISPTIDFYRAAYITQHMQDMRAKFHYIQLITFYIRTFIRKLQVTENRKLQLGRLELAKEKYEISAFTDVT